MHSTFHAEFFEPNAQVIADIRGQPVEPNQIATKKEVIPWTPNMYPAVEGGETIAAMRAAPIRFHVYSEGAPQHFAAFYAWAKANNVAIRFHLNGDLRKAIHAMIVSDVMVRIPDCHCTLRLATHLNLFMTSGLWTKQLSWASDAIQRRETLSLRCASASKTVAAIGCFLLTHDFADNFHKLFVDEPVPLV